MKADAFNQHFVSLSRFYNRDLAAPTAPQKSKKGSFCYAKAMVIKMKNTALVVIDLQNDITKNYKEIIEKVNEAIDWATRKDMWIIYIQHNNLSAGTRTFKPGTRGAEFAPELNVVSDHIFTKSKSSALTSEAFAAFIQERGITDFYIVGADAAACIKSTCFNMTKSGYTVHMLSDCVTSYDKKKLPELLAYYESKGCTVLTLPETVRE